jgi:predicted exporter
MKIVFGILAALFVAVTLFVIVGLGVSYTLLFLNFAGSDASIEPCFRIGFTCGAICGLTAGFFIARYFWMQYWTQYSSSEPE